MKVTFIQRCIGISMIAGVLLFGSAFLASAVNKANATPKPDQIIDDGSGNGRYQMNYTTTVSPATESHGVKIYYEVLVWDTQTGRSKLYYYDYDIDNWKAYGYQLPARPLDY
ncbi:MAG TPA: hypothetical protein VL651_14640 [Bacteroidia bacterium]|jgi:hypothetical protein|nr:hypothetical protein [Bacteroidia bacterium]